MRNWTRREVLGDAADPALGFGPDKDTGFAKAGKIYAPSDPKFDASGWRAVDLPHDWAIDLPFVADPRLVDWGFKPLAREYPQHSVGWYRKVFALPAADAGRRLSLEFDGVFRDCTVALNGHLLGRNLSGYAPFRFDITDVATVGGDNVLVVHVDATEHEGWFYEGAGIYRHVWLVKTAPVHVPQWGTQVTTELAGTDAVVRVLTDLTNDANTPPRAGSCRPSSAPTGARSPGRAPTACGSRRGSARAPSSSCASPRPPSGRPRRRGCTRSSRASKSTARRSTATRRGSACARSASTRTPASSSTAAASRSRAPATTRTTPASAPRSPTGCSTSASSG